MKKALKITGIVIVSIVVILLLAPFLFAGTIEDAIRKSINKDLNAEVAWQDLGLSLFSSFPDAQVNLEGLTVVNNAPFEGDTLAKVEEVSLEMGIWQLFNIGEDPLKINELIVDNALVNIKVDSLGRANYDIAKEQAGTTPADTTGGLVFNVQHYEINNSAVNYLDQSSNTFLRVKKLDHEGTGDFSAENFTLETQSEALVSLKIDSVEYLSGVPVKLVADIKMDLENQKYTFLENEATVNQLPLRFDGYVKVNENNNEVNLTFETPSSDFKNFLAVIPQEYSKNIENVKTTGEFTVKGKIWGVVDEKHIPKLDISIRSEDASFKYPELPKKVEDITIIADLKNETGLMEDTYLNLEKLNFRIDQDIFSAQGNIKDLTGNMKVDMDVKGTLNLANLEKAYPLELEQELNGILKVDMSTSFAMQSLENEQYQDIKSRGVASIENFRYVSPEIPNPVNIQTMSLAFSPAKVTLKEMKASTGQTDATVSGTLRNLMGYLFADSDLKGEFTVKSNTFAVNDFMTVEKESTDGRPSVSSEARTLSSTSKEAINIPSFLDVSLDFEAGKVLYDDLVFENMKGKLVLKDETATLKNVSSNIFNGKIGLEGMVSTRPETPTFQMNLDLANISIGQSFTSMELLQNLAPIAKAMSGTLNTEIQLHGKLNDDLTPILTTIAGDALAEILSAEVEPSQMPLLANLDGKLDFLNLDNINLKDLKTKLQFKDGEVRISPFDFDVKGIKVRVSGAHGFDNSMDYNLVLDLPASYLGEEIGGRLANLSGADLEKMEVELPISLTGTFANPKIKLNTEAAVEELAQKIIEEQKEYLIDKATGKLGDILTDDKNPADSTKTDSTKTQTPKTEEEQIKDIAKDILGGLLGGKEKKKDTTGTKQP